MIFEAERGKNPLDKEPVNQGTIKQYNMPLFFFI